MGLLSLSSGQEVCASAHGVKKLVRLNISTPFVRILFWVLQGNPGRIGFFITRRHAFP